MRSYASDTALPGGKFEEGDEDDEGTAVSCLGVPRRQYLAQADTQRREAFEEVSQSWLPKVSVSPLIIC